jgi:hypothetical protein
MLATRNSISYYSIAIKITYKNTISFQVLRIEILAEIHPCSAIAMRSSPAG